MFVTSLDLAYDLKVSLPFSDHNLISMLFGEEIVPWTEIAEVKLFLQEGRLGSSQDSFTLHSMALCFYGYWHRSSIGCMVWFVFICCRRVYPKTESEEKFKRTMDKRVSKLCRRKKALYKRAKKTCVLTDWDKYSKFNNYVKKDSATVRVGSL